MEDLEHCRLCLASEVKLFSIFRLGLCEKVFDLLSFRPKPNDGFPKSICYYCQAVVQRCYDFKTKTLEVQNVLNSNSGDWRSKMKSHQSINPLTVHSNIINYEFTYQEDSLKAEVELKNEEIKQEINVKDLEVDNNFDCQPLLGSDSEDDLPLSMATTKMLPVEKKVSKPKKKVDKKEDLEKWMGDVEVVFLSEKEQKEEIESRKKSANYLGSFFKCDVCFKGFLSMKSHQNHMMVHDPSSGKYICDICQIRYHSTGRMRCHKVKSHERKYKCKTCDHVSNNSEQARRHYSWHKGVTYDCKKCGKVFSKLTSSLSHMRIHHPTEWVCRLCHESFLGEQGLRVHRKKAHRIQDPEDSHLRCVDCSIKFKDEMALERHRQTSSKHNDMDISMSKHCTVCGNSFQIDMELKIHMRTHKKKFKCSDCDFTCTNTRIYTSHYRAAHLGLGPAEGPAPRKVGEKKYVCEICGMKFNSNAKLHYHQYTHSGLKPFKCELCPKGFSSQQLLKYHIRTHTGERPNVCTICSRAFQHKASLNRHVRVHTGDKPYSCTYCSKAFSQSNSLKVHINTVHMKLPTSYSRKKKMAD